MSINMWLLKYLTIFNVNRIYCGAMRVTKVRSCYTGAGAIFMLHASHKWCAVKMAQNVTRDMTVCGMSVSVCAFVYLCFSVCVCDFVYMYVFVCVFVSYPSWGKSADNWVQTEIQF